MKHALRKVYVSMRLAPLLTIVGLGCLAAGCGKEATAPVPPGSTETTPPAAAAPNTVDPALQKLVGRWERPDGGYVLEISGIEPSGTVTASYHNPNPIRVSRGRVLKEGTTPKVFVELQDVGYPGCTYTLQYDAKSDQLYGQYFQAAMQETFDVTFGRIK